MASGSNVLEESFSHKRLRSEFLTLQAMVRIYCNDHHDRAENLCNDCSILLNYARERLFHCPFQQDKPTCGNCTIHCYKSSMRKKVVEIMRYSGPKMIYKHPLKALQHLFDSRKKPSRLSKG